MSSAIQKPAPTLAQFLEVRRAHIEEVLPKSRGLTAEKLIKLAILATSKNPELKNCDMSSVFLCLLQCAELGLEPSGTLGAAYLVPFKGTCTLIIGYRGLIDLARRSGVLRQIEAHVVHAADRFKLRFGLDPVLEHEPCLDGDPGKARLVYCVAQLADGAKHVEVMTLREIERIQKLSKARNSPWDSHWEEMAKKTVARRTCKWIPMSSDLAKALELEDETDHGRGPDASDVLGLAEDTQQTQTERAKTKVRAKLQAQTSAGQTVDAVADAGLAAHDAEPPDDVPLPTLTAPSQTAARTRKMPPIESDELPPPPKSPEPPPIGDEDFRP